MLNITPTSIFPLKYPKGDSTIPEKGAKAVPVDLDWSKSTSYSVSLLVVQDQKDFGPLRCIWIDASANTHPITVAVNGTEQIFTVQPGTANYYAVVNLNIPVVSFTIGAGEATLTRAIFLNFVPEISMAGQLTIAGPISVTGNVAVTNFPATQAVNVTNFPATQTIAGNVAVTNFPAAFGASQVGAWTVSITGTVAATQSGAWNTGRTWTLASASDSVMVIQGTNPWIVSLASTTITGTVAVTQSGAWATGRTWNLASANDSVDAVQSGAWNVGITGTPNVNATQSGTWVVQQGSAPWSQNLTQVGGTAITLGQKTQAASLPVIDAGVATGSVVIIVVSTGATQTFGSSASKAVNGIWIAFNNFTTAVNLTISIQDGSNNVIFSLPLGITSTGVSAQNYYMFTNLCLNLVNGGNPPKVVVTGGAPSGGSVIFSIAYS